MATSTIIRVRELCGEPPYFFAKDEALGLLRHMDSVITEGPSGIVLDFQDVEVVSASGARVLVYALLRRLGRERFDRLVWAGLDEHCRRYLQEAIDDAIHDVSPEAKSR